MSALRVHETHDIDLSPITLVTINEHIGLD